MSKKHGIVTFDNAEAGDVMILVDDKGNITPAYTAKVIVAKTKKSIIARDRADTDANEFLCSDSIKRGRWVFYHNPVVLTQTKRIVMSSYGDHMYVIHSGCSAGGDEIDCGSINITVTDGKVTNVEIV